MFFRFLKYFQKYYLRPKRNEKHHEQQKNNYFARNIIQGGKKPIFLSKKGNYLTL